MKIKKTVKIFSFQDIWQIHENRHTPVLCYEAQLITAIKYHCVLFAIKLETVLIASQIKGVAFTRKEANVPLSLMLTKICMGSHLYGFEGVENKKPDTHTTQRLISL